MIFKNILAQMRAVLVMLFSCFMVSSCITLSAAEFPQNVYVDNLIPNLSVSGFRVNEGVNSTGLLEVEATFQNQKKNKYDFVYRFIWLDKNNLTIKTRLSNWQSLIVQPRGFATLRGIAPMERATNYRLEVYSKNTVFGINSKVNPDN